MPEISPITMQLFGDSFETDAVQQNALESSTMEEAEAISKTSLKYIKENGFQSKEKMKETSFKAIDLPQEMLEVDQEIEAMMKEIKERDTISKKEQSAPLVKEFGKSASRGEQKEARHHMQFHAPIRPSEKGSHRPETIPPKKEEPNLKEQKAASKQELKEEIRQSANAVIQNEDQEDSHHQREQEKESETERAIYNGMRKPRLMRPRIGVFSLYYLLDKLGLLAESKSWAEYKSEVERNEAETTQVHKKQLEEMQKALDKEKESERWGVMVKVFSWIGSLLSIIAGAALIASGVGAIAGALLMTSGMITLTSQVLEMTGGWRKIAEMLPGDDLEKKRQVVSWMQIGITVLCLILSGIGAVYGGFSNVGKSIQTLMGLVGGIAGMAQGISSIGFGIEQFLFWEHRAEAKKYEIHLTSLRHKKEDLMEKIKEAPDRLKKCYENLADILSFEREINQAFNRAW